MTAIPGPGQTSMGMPASTVITPRITVRQPGPDRRWVVGGCDGVSMSTMYPALRLRYARHLEPAAFGRRKSVLLEQNGWYVMPVPRRESES